MGEVLSDLTVARRILLHLSLFSRYKEEFDCPSDVTQKGIAAALGLSRSHIALEVKGLVEHGDVESRLAHVKTARSRRKVYFLTAAGNRAAESMQQQARKAEAQWIDPRGKLHKGFGNEVLRLAHRRSEALTPVYEALLSGTVVDLREPEVQPPPLPVESPAGREAELQKLKDWHRNGVPVLLLRGLPGIGKTALARAFSQEVEGAVWVQVLPFHSPFSLLSSIAHALDGGGRPRLLAYLKGNPPDLAEAAFLLSREVADLLLVLDDVTSTSAAQVLRPLLETPPSSCHVLMTARRRPTFVKAEDLSRKRVEEMTLDGLTLEGSRELLRQLEVSEERAEELHRTTGGHPLLMKLSAASSSQPRGSEVEASFMDEVLRELSPEERKALEGLSVFRRAVPSEVPGVRPAEIRSLERAGLLTQSGGLYQIHDSLVTLVRRYLGSSREDHLNAAEHWKSVGEWVEVLHHLAQARHADLLELAEKWLDQVLERGQAEELLDVLGEAGEDARYLHLKARALDYLGRWADALDCLEDGLKVASPYLRVQMIMLRGRIHSKRGELGEALRDFEGAAEVCRQEGWQLQLASATYGMGIVLRKKGRMKEALDSMREAMSIFEAERAEPELGRARMEMGIINLQEERPEKAVTWFQDSLPLLSSSKVDSAYLNNNLGIAFSRLERHQESMQAFDESARLAGEAGMLRAEGYALANASDLYIRLGEADRATEYCNRSLHIFEGLEDPLMVSACYANKAKVERVLGHLEVAESLYQESLEALEGAEAPLSLANRWLEVGELYQEMGREDLAKELRAKAMGILGRDPVNTPRS